MLRFEFPSSQKPRIRGKPFKLFSDELPVIDFEKQHLLEKLADGNVAAAAVMFKTRRGKRKDHDSHSLPAIGEKDWDILSGSDRQSIKSESRVQGLNPDIQKIQGKIRERLGIKGPKDEHLPNFFEQSRHQLGQLKQMPKPDEYKKFVQWPRLPSQQIIDQFDMKQNLLNYKDRDDYQQNVQEIRVQSLKNSSVQAERATRLKQRFPNYTKTDSTKELELNVDTRIQIPKNVSRGKKKLSKADSIELNDTRSVPIEEKKEIHQNFKQAVSILKKKRDKSPINQDLASKFTVSDINNIMPLSTRNEDVSTVLVHCDIPRRLLTSKRSVFNTYVGGLSQDDHRTLKKVNFIETIDEHLGDEELDLDKQKTPDQSTEVSTEVKEEQTLKETKDQDQHEKSSNSLENVKPKPVSTYVLHRKDIEQTAKRHLLHDQSFKKRRIQNMMKHFRKIRGIQSMPTTINLNSKHKSVTSKPSEEEFKETIVKENVQNNLSSNVKALPPISSSPAKQNETPTPSNPVSCRMTVSKGQGINEDIETCVQIQKHHGVFKHHKKPKHNKVRVKAVKVSEDCSVTTDEELVTENEIDRSMNGTELIKAYRLWNRKRKQFPGGLRKIDVPYKSVDYLSNMSQKKMSGFSKLSLGLENESQVSEGRQT